MYVCIYIHIYTYIYSLPPRSLPPPPKSCSSSPEVVAVVVYYETQREHSFEHSLYVKGTYIHSNIPYYETQREHSLECPPIIRLQPAGQKNNHDIYIIYTIYTIHLCIYIGMFPSPLTWCSSWGKRARCWSYWYTINRATLKKKKKVAFATKIGLF